MTDEAPKNEQVETSLKPRKRVLTKILIVCFVGVALGYSVFVFNKYFEVNIKKRSVASKPVENTHPKQEPVQEIIKKDKFGWEYETSEDRVTSDIIKTAIIQSFDDYNVHIGLRRSKKDGVDAFVLWTDYIVDSYRNNIVVRFDDRPAQTFSFQSQPDSKCYIVNSKRFIAELMKSKKAVVRIPVIKKGYAYIDAGFNVEGLVW